MIPRHRCRSKEDREQIAACLRDLIDDEGGVVEPRRAYQEWRWLFPDTRDAWRGLTDLLAAGEIAPLRGSRPTTYVLAKGVDS